jgi:integral membrane sensor domain MASE1
MKVRHIAETAAVFIAYYLTAKWGLELQAVSGFATLAWPPTGIAIATLFLFGRHIVPAIFLGAFLVNYQVGAPLLVAAGIGVGNALEAMIAVALLERGGFKHTLARARDVIWFVVVAGISALTSATIGVTSLVAAGVISGSAYDITWRAWWSGDILGALIVAPLLFIWLGVPLPRQVSWPLLIYVAFSGLASSLIYLAFIPIIWIAARLGQRNAVSAIALLAAASVWATVHHLGPFKADSLFINLLSVQLFLTAIAVPTLILAAIIADRRRDHEQTEFVSVTLKEHTKLEA